MQISPVSFCGKKEITSFEKEAGRKLTSAEKLLAKTACEFHDLEVETTGDGDYLENPAKAREVSARYLDALHNVGASKFAYMVAVDTLTAPVISYRVSPIYKEDLVEEALQIAKRADDVDKFDVIKDIKKFD